jgi:hypothetical protein
MRVVKILLCTICVIATITAAVMAIIVFKNEIACFFADIKLRIDEKRLRRNGEYADYADV